MTVYEIEVSQEFVIQGYRRYRRTRRLARVIGGARWVFAALFFGVTILAVVTAAYAVAAVLGLPVFLLGFGNRLDEVIVARRFRKSPYWGDRVRVVLSEEGFDGKGVASSTQISWKIFTVARRFTDGWILFQGQGLYNWLPDDCLVEGSQEEIGALIRSKVGNCREV